MDKHPRHCYPHVLHNSTHRASHRRIRDPEMINTPHNCDNSSCVNAVHTPPFECVVIPRFLAVASGSTRRRTAQFSLGPERQRAGAQGGTAAMHALLIMGPVLNRQVGVFQKQPGIQISFRVRLCDTSTTLAPPRPHRQVYWMLRLFTSSKTFALCASIARTLPS
jgi:hypothetical protein